MDRIQWCALGANSANSTHKAGSQCRSRERYHDANNGNVKEYCMAFGAAEEAEVIARETGTLRRQLFMTL